MALKRPYVERVGSEWVGVGRVGTWSFLRTTASGSHTRQVSLFSWVSQPCFQRRAPFRDNRGCAASPLLPFPTGLSPHLPTFAFLLSSSWLSKAVTAAQSLLAKTHRKKLNIWKSFIHDISPKGIKEAVRGSTPRKCSCGKAPTPGDHLPGNRAAMANGCCCLKLYQKFCFQSMSSLTLINKHHLLWCVFKWNNRSLLSYNEWQWICMSSMMKSQENTLTMDLVEMGNIKRKKHLCIVQPDSCKQ